MPANREKTGRRKANAGSFRAGDPRINRRGRPPINPDVREALTAACPAAVRRLVELSESDDEHVALKASAEIVERNLGKSVQPLLHQGLEHLSDAELEAKLHAAGWARANGHDGNGEVKQ